MVLRTEGRNIGTVGTLPTAGWLTRNTSAEAHGARQIVLTLVMTAIGRQLRVWVNVVPRTPKETPQTLPPAHQGKCLPAGMIRPSTHHRATIASRRDDWP